MLTEAPAGHGRLRTGNAFLSWVHSVSGRRLLRAGKEWLFPLDLILRLIPAAEWELAEAGVGQRVRALEAFLAASTGRVRWSKDKVAPRSLLTTWALAG